MTAHFEDLWVACEKFHQEMPVASTVNEVLNELIMKANFYKKMTESTSLPPEEMKQFEVRAMGEVLLVLTHLSSKLNIDVFNALNSALQYRSVERQATLPL